MLRVVSNTSPLYYLGALGRLDLLRQIYQHIVVPPAVVAELKAGKAGGHPAPLPEDVSWIEIRSAQSESVLAMVPDLGAGEREAIALAHELQPSLLLIDDHQGRERAHLLKLDVIGTLGLLLLAKQRNLIPRIRPVFDELAGLGFRMSAALATGLLRQAGEA